MFHVFSTATKTYLSFNIHKLFALSTLLCTNRDKLSKNNYLYYLYILYFSIDLMLYLYHYWFPCFKFKKLKDHQLKDCGNKTVYYNCVIKDKSFIISPPCSQNEDLKYVYLFIMLYKLLAFIEKSTIINEVLGSFLSKKPKTKQKNLTMHVYRIDLKMLISNWIIQNHFN